MSGGNRRMDWVQRALRRHQQSLKATSFLALQFGSLMFAQPTSPIHRVRTALVELEL